MPIPSSRYFTNSMEVLLSIQFSALSSRTEIFWLRLRPCFLAGCGNGWAAGEGQADDASEDEFFEQQRGGEREGEAADDDQTLQHCFHDLPPCSGSCLTVYAQQKSSYAAIDRALKIG